MSWGTESSASCERPPCVPAAAGDVAFPAHPALSGIAHEDGAPDGREGVILINAFEVPEDGDARFLQAWRGTRDLLAAQRGYLGTRLHRSLAPADYRFVNVARW